MSEFSNYLEEKIIETTLRGAAFPVPSGVYVALFKTDPTDAGSGTEVNTTEWPAYARKDAAAGGAISSGWTANADGQSSNAKEVAFAANDGAGAVTVTHLALFDAASGGNLLYHTALDASKTLQVGDVLSFAIGAITVTVA